MPRKYVKHIKIKHHQLKLKAFWSHFLPKTNMEIGADIKLFAIRLLHICIECLWMDFKFREIWKHWSLEKTGSSYEHKFVSSDNLPQHILGKVKKKKSEIGQDQKNLRSVFV